MTKSHNKLARVAAVMALSSVALAGCSAESQSYCHIDDGELIVESSFGYALFDSSETYRNDTARLYGGSAKEYFLSTISTTVAEQLPDGTPMSLKVIASETQSADAEILMNDIETDLTVRGLAIKQSELEIQATSRELNPYVGVQPIC